MVSDWLNRLPESLLLAASVLAALGSIIGAMRSGVLRRVRLGNIELEGSSSEQLELRQPSHTYEPPPIPGTDIPFESQQLAKYYSQVLGQSRVSFWFSLIFASLGFAVIIAAALMYSDKTTGSSIASFVAGVIVDAVAALFFVQSRESQKAMAEFFDKLRVDRERLESRRMVEMISDGFAKDAARLQLALHLAGVPEGKIVADSIIESTLVRQAARPAG